MSDIKPRQSLTIDDTAYETTLTRKFMERRPHVASDPRQVLAYIPGVIQKIYVTVGQQVQRGDPLLVLEAMKMQNDLTAEVDGTVKTIHVTPGKMVGKGELLIEFE